MSEFRSAHRTVVTELNSFVVDTVSRTAAFRQSVSAKIPDSSALDRRDFNVSASQDFEIDNSEVVLGILSPEPVQIEFQQDSIASLPPEEISEYYERSVIEVDSSGIAGMPIEFDIIDKDILPQTTSIEVVVYNKTTGETDHINAVRTHNNRFHGQVHTVVSIDKGIDFDSSLNVAHNHYVQIIHVDNTVPEGEDPNVIGEVKIESPYHAMKITTSPYIFPTHPVAVQVEFEQQSHAGTLLLDATNVVTGEKETLTLTEVRTGVFQGLLSTGNYAGSFVNEDNLMEVQLGDTIELSYTQEPAVSTPNTTFYVGVINPRNITGLFSGDESIKIGETVQLTLTDYNIAGVGTIDIPFANNRTREFDMVTFVEVVQGSGIFKGSIDIVDKDTPTSDNKLSADVGDVVQATYMDNNSAISPLFRITHDVIVEQQDIITEPDVETPVPEQPDYGTITFIVDGLFYLNGMYNGKVIVRGLKEEHTRCVLLHA